MANIATSPGASAPVVNTLSFPQANVVAARPWQDGWIITLDLPDCRLVLKTKAGPSFAVGDRLTLRHYRDFKDISISHHNGAFVEPPPLAVELIEHHPREHTMLTVIPAQTAQNILAGISLDLAAPANPVGAHGMRPLIPINARPIDGHEVQTVNARELHAFLESKIRFNDWIRQRIEQYGFKEGVDYARFELEAGIKMSENGGEIGGIANAQKNVALESMGYDSFGQQGRIEYALTLDMAKELSMVERNEKGKQARQYFIECEKKAKQSAPARPANYLEALKALVVSTETLIAVKLENDTLKLRLDRHKEFASIKRMCRHYRQNFDWLPLRHASQLLELPIRKVYDANYGHVNAYHADVWREAYALEIPNGLSEER